MILEVYKPVFAASVKLFNLDEELLFGVWRFAESFLFPIVALVCHLLNWALRKFLLSDLEFVGALAAFLTSYFYCRGAVLYAIL